MRKVVLLHFPTPYNRISTRAGHNLRSEIGFSKTTPGSFVQAPGPTSVSATKPHSSRIIAGLLAKPPRLTSRFFNGIPLSKEDAM
jgi:hypothetical protein